MKCQQLTFDSMDFCSVLLILADKDEKKSLTIFSTSRWKINVLHILGCGQLHVFLLKLNSAVPGIHIAFSLNPQQRSHLTQFFPEIPSFPIIVTLGNGPEIVKCVMSGGMYYPEFQIFSQVFALSCFSVRPWTSLTCSSPTSLSLLH